MTSLGSPRGVRACAAAVPGCQHVLAGTPCQDATRILAADDRVILAVSDGHGDAQYTHSDEGARIAVAVAVDVLGLILDRVSDNGELIDLIPPLKRRIAFEWNRRVKHHARMVAAQDGTALLWPDEVTGDWDEKVKPYGCTLIAAAITDRSTIWLRIGDGEALAIASGGDPQRIFVAADKSMGQATYSLSMRSAIDHIDVVLAPATTGEQLIVLATDGVTDQYDVDPSFEHEWGTSMLERIHAAGWTSAMMDLPRHLGTVARDGDDCSIAIGWLPPPNEPDETK